MDTICVPVVVYSAHTFNTKTPERYNKPYSVVCTKDSNPEIFYTSLETNWPKPEDIEAIIVTEIGNKNMWGEDTDEWVFNREEICKFKFDTRQSRFINTKIFPNYQEILLEECSKAVNSFQQAIFTNENNYRNCELHVIINDPEDIKRDQEKYSSCRCGCGLRGTVCECEFESESDSDSNVIDLKILTLETSVSEALSDLSLNKATTSAIRS